MPESPSTLLASERVRKALGELEAVSSNLPNNRLWRVTKQNADQANTVDGGNYPYTHVVLNGGGTLGIAHLGAIFGLERAGVRIVGCGGTSAGAIIALLLCCARTDQPDCWDSCLAPLVIPLLESMPTAAFVDGKSSTRAVLRRLQKKGPSRLTRSLRILSLLGVLSRRFGLNPGLAFYLWLERNLYDAYGIRTFNDLSNRMEAQAAHVPAGLADPEKKAWRKYWETNNACHRLLNVIATALSYGLKIQFPKNLEIFDDTYCEQSPAFIARTSMSVPLFFEPYEMVLDQPKWRVWLDERERRWQSSDALARLKRITSLAFVDGGVLSNFPIDSFIDHQAKNERICGMPTLGISLTSTAIPPEQSRKRGLSLIAAHAQAILTALRQQRDREAFDVAHALGIASGEEASIQILPVDTGDHNWLNFNLSATETEDLFVRGLNGARDWIEHGGPMDKFRA